ncbi:hypothetical protein [Pendulispora albinea]|uniref:Secreted protein n=1 Tax=Pendulispora albinea TaxID=2741071 RepID=A0ABZ2LY11_9BACT
MTYSSLTFLSAISIALCLAGTACSSNDDPPLRPNPNPQSDPSPDPKTVARARDYCIQLRNSVVAAAARCGNAEKEVRAAFDAEFGSGCYKVVGVRNENALRLKCIPSFETISCTDFNAAKWEPSCEKQLLMPKSSLTARSPELEPSELGPSELGPSEHAPENADEPSNDALKSLVGDPSE